MITVTIDYERGDPASYRGIELWQGGSTWAFFNYGNPYLDWDKMGKYFALCGDLTVYYDHTVYQFVKDGGVLEGAVLPVESIGELVYA